MSEPAVASFWACNRPTLPAKTHSRSAANGSVPHDLTITVGRIFSLPRKRSFGLRHRHTPTNVEPGTHMEYAAWPHSPRRNLRLHLSGPATDQRSQPRLTHAVPQTAQSHMTSPSLLAESSACQENVRSGLDTDTHPQTWNLELTWNMQPGWPEIAKPTDLGPHMSGAASSPSIA